MAAIKRILETPTMATIWRKEATRRKLARSKVKNMEMSLQVSLHWQSVTWDCELLKPQVFLSFCQTKPLQRRRKAKRIKRTWQNSLLIRSILSFCSSQLCGFVSNKTHVDFLIFRRQQKTFRYAGTLSKKLNMSLDKRTTWRTLSLFLHWYRKACFSNFTLIFFCSPESTH